MRAKLLSGGLIAAALLFGATAAQAQDVTLRLHQFLPPQATIPSKAIDPWIERVETESGGRIEIQHFPAMQLGGAPPSLFDQARDGVVDIVWTVLGYTPGRFNKTEAFELPFMVTTGEATSRAFHEYVTEAALDEFADVQPLVFHTHGPGLLHVKGDGVRAIEDMDGLKLRGPTRVITAVLDRLGATAIGMPVPAVPESLSKGVIDGAVIPWEVTVPLRVSELVETHTGFDGDHGLYTATFAMVMNRDSYESLPDDLKAVIDANSGVEAAALFGSAMDAGDIVGRQRAEEAGNSIVMLDAAETDRWRTAAEPIIDAWIADMNDSGADGTALVERARALIAEHSAP
ncbi:TRAP transporter substrate-binding protein [Algihabitans albus]|uniref:TRAP transporter substrate-binding protein n=1 Tax=Algihabitans albus TaxID=2164067 RepID=UPI000E5C854B|nr:TRAP transporter substrate-binding protein [Algihabitans albus]